MADTEITKLRGILEATRQRLMLALSRESPIRRQEHVRAADELLDQAERMLRKAS